MNKKAAIIKDIIKNTSEKKTPIIGKGSDKGTGKKSGRKSIEILDDDDDNDIQFQRGCKRRELPDGGIYIVCILFKIFLTMNI